MAPTNDAAPDLVLADGREIRLNLGLISAREYRALFDKTQPQAAEDETMARVAGLTVAEYLDLPFLDFRRLGAAFFKKVREPLADPN